MKKKTTIGGMELTYLTCLPENGQQIARLFRSIINEVCVKYTDNNAEFNDLVRKHKQSKKWLVEKTDKITETEWEWVYRNLKCEPVGNQVKVTTTDPYGNTWTGYTRK